MGRAEFALQQHGPMVQDLAPASTGSLQTAVSRSIAAVKTSDINAWVTSPPGSSRLVRSATPNMSLSSVFS
jgi:hypothetical protein